VVTAEEDKENVAADVDEEDYPVQAGDINE
jgi:hypothetical protein